MNVARQPIRVVLIDDHQVVLHGVRAVVDSAPEFLVVGEYMQPASALAAMNRLQPDLVVLDMRLGNVLAPEVCRGIRGAAPRSRMLILTGFAEPPILRACLDEGATGVMFKSSGDLELLDAMRRVHAGELVLEPVVERELVELGSRTTAVHDDGQLIAELRTSEYRVLRLMAAGMSTSEIQQELGLSRNTVRSYVQSVMEKLGVHSRVQAVVKASQLRLL